MRSAGRSDGACHDVRVLEPGELRAAHDLFAATIHRGPRDDEGWARTESTYSPGRTLGVREPGGLVATATSFPSRTVVPGGAVLSMAAVTRVGVRADRTRRGLLTAMMGAQFAGATGRAEPLATLRASEARIYGRFGYGVATRGRALRVRRSDAGWRDRAPAGGAVRLLARDEIIPVFTAVYERIGLGRPGAMTRPPGWWQSMYGHAVQGREHLLAAVHTGPHGDDGFALAEVDGRDGEGFAHRTLRVEDLHAADVGAAAGLWRFLLDVDLVGAVEGWLRPIDEPLELLLCDPRDCTTTGRNDETWLRILDVPVALAARSFPAMTGAAAAPVLLAVHDPLLPANAGVYRIGGGPAERVGPLGAGRPELECDVAGLSMAYLGDRAPSALVATGWWRAHAAEAVTRADLLFATAAVPWCGTFF
jgi:predicted acetyltransferase